MSTDVAAPPRPVITAQSYKMAQKKPVRITVDLDSEQSRFLKLFALENDISGALVARALLSVLEQDLSIAHRVLDDISAEDAVKTNNPRADKSRTTARFTVDLEATQHRFLKLFALENDIKAAVVMRAMLYILETDLDIANQVIEQIFAQEEVIL